MEAGSGSTGILEAGSGSPSEAGSSTAAWPTPTEATSTLGFGGGLAWAEETGLCEALINRFDAETFDYFGARLFSFVSCEEITDALLRGFATWSANHGRLNFFSATD